MSMRLPEDILRGLEQLEAQFAEALSVHSALVGGTKVVPQRCAGTESVEEGLTEHGPHGIEQLRQRLAEVVVGEGEGEYLSQAAAAIFRETRSPDGTMQEVKLEMLRNVLAQTAGKLDIEESDPEEADDVLPDQTAHLRQGTVLPPGPRRHRKKRRRSRAADADDLVSSPASRPTPQMATQLSPSPAAKGKKPMAYPQHSQQIIQTQQAQQQQPRSERAASKAPLAYQAPTPAQNRHPSPPSSNASKSRNTNPLTSQKGKANANKIWSTSTTEERERIKEFWLGLSEEERRDLVKIEKDTVLKKMKEQQKHSCSCAVCGRKRNAIEEELEVLYDAYYEELEQYANHQQRYVNSGGTIPPPPGPGPFPGSVELDKNGAVVSHIPPNNNGDGDNNVSGGGGGGKRRGGKQRQQPPSINGRIAHPTAPYDHVHLHPHHNHHHHKESEFEEDEGDVYEEEEYEEEEEEEEEEDDEDEDEEDDGRLVNGRGKATRQIPLGRRGVGGKGERKMNGKQRDGFNLTNLAVSGPGNILTVADDLLKNDGQKFLEMMEQLAERRMQREEEAAADVEDSEEDSEEEEGSDVDDGEDGEGGSEDEEDEEDEEEEIMTEEQKMEEGKRMFSIFAARMFEQRVLQAYREKVAQERQMQLLRELEDEDKLTKEREQKKQSANQRKKDKKRQQKLAREEEKAAKAAERAAEEAAVKARQTAIEEENKRRREEERAKREATRKAAEEERARKEEEKRKRVQEEREREAARELKKKEREERLKAERREKEEKERKVKEEKEVRLAKEREEKEKEKEKEKEREKEKRERDERDERERIEKEKKALKEKEEREAKDRLAAQQRTAAAAGPSSVKQAGRNIPPATSPVKSNSSGLSTSGSSPAGLQRSPNTSMNNAISSHVPTLAKKGSYNNNKPPVLSTSMSSPNILVNPNRAPAPPHLAQISQPSGSSSRGPPGISQPPTPHTPQLPHSSHVPPTPGMMFGSQGQPGGMMSSSALSPRLGNFGHGTLASGHVSFGFNAAGGGPPTPHPQHLGMHSHQPQPQQLQPSALPRGNFNNGPTSFDPAFQRVPVGGFNPASGAGMPSPIGPPSKPKTPMTMNGGSSGSPTIPGGPSLAPGSGRRSIHDLPSGSNAPGVAPGPISRPIAPIARPMGPIGADNSSPRSNSPVKRSPSPKGVVLGSSALAADDDEVVPVATRRSTTTTPFGVSSIGSGVGGGVGIGVSGVGVIGQPHWGSSSPRDALARSAPWGPPSGFSAALGTRPGGAPPLPIGSSGMMNHNHNHHGNPLHPISSGHSQHPAGPPGALTGNAGTFSLWGTPAPVGPSSATADWHTGPPGIIGTPFFSNTASFMGHNHNTAPGSPVTHTGAGAGGGGGA